MTVSCGTTAKLTNLQDYSLDYLASPHLQGRDITQAKKNTAEAVLFFIMSPAKG